MESTEEGVKGSGEDEDEEIKKGGPNYQEALSDLSNIALSAKRILEEDAPSIPPKRTKLSPGPLEGPGGETEEGKKTNEEERSEVMKEEKEEEKKEMVKNKEVEDDGEESSVKDGLMENGGGEESAASSIEEFKRVFKKMSKSELQDLVLKKMVAFLCCESEMGALRQKCDLYDEMNEKWKKKVQALQKQCQDLNTVMRRYITDANNHPKERVTPVRVTRSVGLQVFSDRKPPSQASTPKVPPVRRIPNNSSITVLPISETQKTPKSIVEGLNKGISITRAEPTSKAKRNVIDVVDLSDDDEDPSKAKATPRAQAEPPTKSFQVGNANLAPPKTTLVPVSSPMSSAPSRSSTSTAISLFQPRPRLIGSFSGISLQLTHPAPLPEALPQMLNVDPSGKTLPPKPSLKLSRLKSGIVLSWNLELKAQHATVISYQLFAYQETSSPPCSSLWKKVGDVKALPLPMACTLTQFMKGNKYHFSIRALDCHNRVGPFSDPSSILLS